MTSQVPGRARWGGQRVKWEALAEPLRVTAFSPVPPIPRSATSYGREKAASEEPKGISRPRAPEHQSPRSPVTQFPPPS